MELDAKTVAACCLADHAKSYGFAAGVEAAEVQGKLADLITTLRNLGLNWGNIFAFISMILPMITSGKFDWEKLLAWLATLVPAPTPVPPGPLSS